METVNISELRSNLEKANSGCQIAGDHIAPVNQRELARKQLKALASTARIDDITSPTGAEWGALK